MRHQMWLFLLLGWNVFIIVISLIPAATLPEISWADAFALDKWIHAGVYFVLTFLLSCYVMALKNQRFYKRIGWILTLLYCSFTGWYTEVLQSLMYAGRYFDVLDLIANIIGIITGLLFILLMNKKFNQWGLLPSHNS